MSDSLVHYNKNKYIDFHGKKWYSSNEYFLNSNGDSKDIKLKKCEFICDMRRLWEDHVIWTRCFIISVAHDLGDTKQTLERLLQNQKDLGNKIGIFYNDKVKKIITKLLIEHIEYAGKIIQAVKIKDTNVKEFIDKWYKNANEISHALYNLNHKHWDLDVLKNAMKKHLDDTLSEASHRLNGEYEKDIEDYDKVHHHILIMSDVLSHGIIKQFNNQF